jgi:hypothetical protein
MYTKEIDHERHRVVTIWGTVVSDAAMTWLDEGKGIRKSPEST